MRVNLLSYLSDSRNWFIKEHHLVCHTNSGGVILPTPFFIFLNLHFLILLEHHCYHLHFPSKHIQTLNQIPYIQPSINSSLSLSFNKFHKKKKEKPLKIHLQPLCKWVYIILVSELRFKGFSRVLGLKFLGNILLISSLPFYITLFMLFFLYWGWTIAKIRPLISC